MTETLLALMAGLAGLAFLGCCAGMTCGPGRARWCGMS